MFVLAQPALQTFHCCSNFGKWLPPHAHSWLTLNILKERESLFWNMLHGPLRWAPEDSPFIWQESNLVVWAHLEFVSTDNLDISWPTNTHKRSFYIYWEWTSSHALLGFLLGGRNSRTTYPSPKLKALIFMQIERDLKIILFFKSLHNRIIWYF